jgi:hypothetical protein
MRYFIIDSDKAQCTQYGIIFSIKIMSAGGKMDNKINHAIHQIFQIAHNDNRKILYEHEVYNVLSLIGLDVPQCVFLTEISAVDESVLYNFHSPNP